MVFIPVAVLLAVFIKLIFIHAAVCVRACVCA